MRLKEMLVKKLPQNLAGVRGGVTTYTIGEAIGYRPQSISEWFRKDQITIPCIQMLMKIEDHNLVISDFRPFCADLESVMILMEIESKKG